jgi:hypothetical protein
MKVTLNQHNLVIERENSPKVYKDSTLMTWVKRELQRQGHDVITKDLSKEDGNLLSDGCYGITARNRDFQAYYPNYCINNAYEDYNAGRLVLGVVR